MMLFFRLYLWISLSFCLFISINASSAPAPITTKELNLIIATQHLPITITPEVLAEINTIRSNPSTKNQMIVALEKMKNYQPYILSVLKTHEMPNSLLALPIVESGYESSPQQTDTLTAGIWGLTIDNAKLLGLKVNEEKDERKDVKRSTVAVLGYINKLHSKYQDWELAVMAYEIGPDNLDVLMAKSGSRDPWMLARSTSLVPALGKDKLTHFLARFEASILLMNNPSLLVN